jgi:hypothetical protein
LEEHSKKEISMKKTLLTSAMRLALTSYAGAQDANWGKTDGQSKKESVSYSEHEKH